MALIDVVTMRNFDLVAAQKLYSSSRNARAGEVNAPRA
jgi:hypothetical protein